MIDYRLQRLEWNNRRQQNNITLATIAVAIATPVAMLILMDTLAPIATMTMRVVIHRVNAVSAIAVKNSNSSTERHIAPNAVIPATTATAKTRTRTKSKGEE